MSEKLAAYTTVPIESLIITIRGQRVILDVDLARIYGVPTKRLNEQVKRNADRFPVDFVFQLTLEEVTNLKSQIATSSSLHIQSQIATGSTHGGRRKLPFAFTEHGAIMAANVLKSPEAVKMSVFVWRGLKRIEEGHIFICQLLKSRQQAVGNGQKKCGVRNQEEGFRLVGE